MRIAKRIGVRNQGILGEGDHEAGIKKMESIQMFKTLDEFKKSRKIRRGSGVF